MHQLLLARVDTTPAPIIALHELLPLPEADWRSLVSAGVLVETEPPVAVEVAPGRWLRVQRATDQFIGFDECENCPSPEPLSREDVAQYRVSIPALLDHLRAVNGIDGRKMSVASAGLQPLGRKQMSGGVAHAWFALHLGTPENIAARLALLAQDNAHGAHVVVFPVWPNLPPAAIAAHARAGVWLADLDAGSLTIRWPAELQAGAGPDVPAYALISEGATWRVHFLGETFSVRALKGILLLARLLEDPSQTWTPLELERGFRAADHGPAAADDDGLVVADQIGADIEVAGPKQIAIYRQELVRLQRQLAEAETDGRELEITEAAQELADWQARMQQTVGLGGRARLFGAKERARKNVRKLIDEALDRITSANTRAGRHLRRRIRLGSVLTYTPDPGEMWQVRFPAERI